jgi:hypothetical protein
VVALAVCVSGRILCSRADVRIIFDTRFLHASSRCLIGAYAQNIAVEFPSAVKIRKI